MIQNDTAGNLPDRFELRTVVVRFEGTISWLNDLQLR